MRENLRDGLQYEVWNTGGGIFRIGAQIDTTKPMHGGNVHFLPMLYDTREEAQQDLDMLISQSRGDES